MCADLALWVGAIIVFFFLKERSVEKELLLLHWNCSGILSPKVVEEVLSVMLGEWGDLKKSLMLVCLVPAFRAKLSRLDELFLCFSFKLFGG